MSEPLLSVRDLTVHFSLRTGGLLGGRYQTLKAVDGIGFDLLPGETLGIVGETGCGKSTLARAVVRLIKPTAGQVLWLGTDIAGLDSGAMRPKRREMQIVFQDPLASLNPRMAIGESIAEPLKTFEPGLSKQDRTARITDMLAKVGLPPSLINRYPHELSGGQCQRVGIARAMILNPKLIACDEPVSALDVSIRAQILNLLLQLQREFELALLFISHDLAIVRHVSHRIMVLYLGRVMEIADRDTLYRLPRHPYTHALISAVRMPDPDWERNRQRIVLKGDLPSPLNPPAGCVFRTRCPYAADVCAERVPPLENIAKNHRVACHRWQEISGR